MFKQFSGLEAVLKIECQSITVEVIDELVAAAIADFPALKRSEITIVSVPRISKFALTAAISFEIPDLANIPSEYEEMNALGISH